MMLSGIIGLFIGSVVLSISYTIFTSWVENSPDQLQESASIKA